MRGRIGLAVLAGLGLGQVALAQMALAQMALAQMALTQPAPGWAPPVPATVAERAVQAKAWLERQRSRDLRAEAETFRGIAREALRAQVEIRETPPDQLSRLRLDRLQESLSGFGGRRAASALAAGDAAAASRILGESAAGASSLARALAPEPTAGRRGEPRPGLPPAAAAIAVPEDRTLGLSVAHPAVALLLMEGQPACSATLVRPDAVLTAAHCVCPPGQYPDARACGASPWRDGRRWQVFFQHAGLYSVTADGIAVPEDWSWGERRIAGDLAVMRLARPVPWIEPVGLHLAPAVAEAPAMQVAGFGLRSRGADMRDSVEPGMKTVVRIEGQACTDRGEPYLDRSRQWCSPRLGDGGRTFGIICQGDSGGLVLGRSGDGTMNRQVAVISGNHAPSGLTGEALAGRCAGVEQRAFYSRLDAATAAAFLQARLPAMPAGAARPAVPALQEAFEDVRLIAEPWRFLDQPVSRPSRVRAPRPLPADADLLVTVNSPDPLTQLELWGIRAGGERRLPCAEGVSADANGRHVLECRVPGQRQGMLVEARLLGGGRLQSPYQLVVTALPPGSFAAR